MKTLLKITKDYYSDFAYQNKIEDINYLVNELNVHCEIANNSYINIVEEQKRYNSDKEDYTDCEVIEAKGYCQGEWQRFHLYYNKKDLNTPMFRSYFKSLVTHLERTFTHQNSYFAELFEVTKINGKKFTSEPFDFTTFCIDNIEFPEKDEVLKFHNSCFGVMNYDEAIIEID